MYINNHNSCWNIKNAVRGEKHTRKRSLCGWRWRAGCRAEWLIRWLGRGHLRSHVIDFCGWAQLGWEECYEELEMSAQGGKYLLSKHIFQGEIISNITHVRVHTHTRALLTSHESAAFLTQTANSQETLKIGNQRKQRWWEAGMTIKQSPKNEECRVLAGKTREEEHLVK